MTVRPAPAQSVARARQPAYQASRTRGNDIRRPVEMFDQGGTRNGTERVAMTREKMAEVIRSSEYFRKAMIDTADVNTMMAKVAGQDSNYALLTLAKNLFL